MSDKFTDGNTWLLSKTIIDPKPGFISSQVKFKVDLRRSKMESAEELDDELPALPVPSRSAAEITHFKLQQHSDLLALVKSVSESRAAKDTEVADVELLDNSTIDRDGEHSLATIKVSVWGTDKIQKVRDNVGKPMVFYMLSIMGNKSGAFINHYPDGIIFPAPECEKTETLVSKVDELQEAENTVSLARNFVPNSSRDVSGPRDLYFAAFLDGTRDN